MALKLEDKKSIVAEVSEVAKGALSAAVAEYRGMTSAQMTEFRAEARKSGVYLRVVRNTLAKRAIKGTHFECMTDALVGQLVLAFASEEPGAAAKLLKEYTKKTDKLVVKNLAMSGNLYGPEKLDDMAKLPNREQALSMLAGVLQAPVTKFVRTLNEIPSQAVRVIAAVRDQKQASE